MKLDRTESLFATIMSLLGLIMVFTNPINAQECTDIYNVPTLPNASTYLNTPTYDGSGESVHPDIIYRPEGWNGWKYWLLFEPYPAANDILENPSILVSNDGITWQTISTNPITPPIDISKFHSDGDMLIVGNTLYVYYRIEDRHTYTNMFFRRISSIDGVHWTAPINTSVTLEGSKFASPAIIYENNTYYLFFVDTITKTVHRMTSGDGLVWSNDVVVLSSPYAWHIDVVKYQNHYLMLVAERLLNPEENSSLYYYSSENMTDWTFRGKVLSPSDSPGWDSANIYRSTFIIDGSKFRVWYSAFKDNGTTTIWHTGYTEDPSWSYVTQNCICNRCSTQNGCERVQFQSADASCTQPIEGTIVTRTTDCSCNDIGGISRCSQCVTPTTTPKIGDLNDDKKVDVLDLRHFLTNFLKSLTIFDYNKMVENFGK